MNNEFKLGMISLPIPAIIIIISLYVKIDFVSEFNWIMIVFSISSALIIPFLYDRIKQDRKKKKVKKIIKRHLILIKGANAEYKHAKKILDQIVDDLYIIGPYFQDAYDEIEYIDYFRRIKNLKALGMENKSTRDYYDLALEELKAIEQI